MNFYSYTATMPSHMADFSLLLDEFRSLIDKKGIAKKKELKLVYDKFEAYHKAKHENIISDEKKDEKKEVIKDKRLMEWKGLFGGSISRNGYKIDVLKSALQKYGRRRMLKEMFWCVNELNDFELIEEKKAEKVRTNMVNRLKVMLCEELVFSDWQRFLYCVRELNKWEEKRNNVVHLYRVCSALCDGKLCRLASDIKAYWKDGVSSGLVEIEQEKQKRRDMDEKEDDPEVKRFMNNLVSCVEKKSEECFYWMFEILRKAEDNVKGKKRFRKSGCEYIIWEWLFECSKRNMKMKEVMRELMILFDKKDRKERYIFVCNALCLVLYSDRVNWEEKEIEYDARDIDISNDVKLDIDDYCIDMHCSDGRKKGKDKKTFALEGSFVVNEDKEFFREEWRQIYQKLKHVDSEEKKDEKKEIEHISWDELVGDNPVFCNEGNVCAMKKPCIQINYKGKDYVIKEISQLKMGYSQRLVDSLKEKVGLRRLNVRIIKSDASVQKKDRKLKSYKNNYIVKKQEAHYILLDKIENAMMFAVKKEKINNLVLRKQFIRIICYRSIFDTSDSNLRNILLTEEKEEDNLTSIDEMTVFKDGLSLCKWNKDLRALVRKDLQNNEYDDVLSSFENIKDCDLERVLSENGYREHLARCIENKNNIRKRLEEETKKV